MIRNFRHKGLARLYEHDETKGVHHAHVRRLRAILARLDESETIADMDLPGLRLHPLKGAYADFWAVNVSGNWRVVFRFEDGHALDVDYIDYH